MSYRDSKVTGMLMGRRKKGGLQKKMDVSVYVSSKDDAVGADPDENTKWMKEDLARDVQKVKDYKEILETWVPEEVAARAKADVELQLAECKLRVQETRGRIKLRSKKEAK